MNYGDFIRQYRKEKKMTQKQLAQKSGVSMMSIRRYEKNERVPSIEHLKKIASSLGISVFELDPSLYENTFNKKVGENIATIRKREKISQEKLAQILNTTKENIEKIESGNSILNASDIENIAKKLNIHTHALLSGVDIDYIAVKEDRSNLGRQFAKQLAIIKFLDAIYDGADITKIKIFDKESQKEIYNLEYASYRNWNEEFFVDFDDLEKLINVFENICKNMLQAYSTTEAEFLSDYCDDKKHFYRFFTESINFTTSTKIKYNPISEQEAKQIYKEVQKEIAENANKTEFVIDEPGDSEEDNESPNS